MRARLLTLTRVAALVAAGAGLGTAALSQATKAPPPEWSQTVTKEPGGELDAKQLEIVQKLTAYFNEMGEMKGEFQQISPDGKRLRGKKVPAPMGFPAGLALISARPRESGDPVSGFPLARE